MLGISISILDPRGSTLETRNNNLHPNPSSCHGQRPLGKIQVAIILIGTSSFAAPALGLLRRKAASSSGLTPLKLAALPARDQMADEQARSARRCGDRQCLYCGHKHIFLTDDAAPNTQRQQ